MFRSFVRRSCPDCQVWFSRTIQWQSWPANHERNFDGGGGAGGGASFVPIIFPTAEPLYAQSFCVSVLSTYGSLSSPPFLLPTTLGIPLPPGKVDSDHSAQRWRTAPPTCA